MAHEVAVNPSGDFDPVFFNITSTPAYPYTSTYTYWGTNTVYMYQLKCPDCRKMNWCELDKTTECKCGTTLKAVLKKVDHEVEVG